MDETVVNVALREAVPAGVNILNKANPTTASKAVKNPVETENVRQAHVKDGIAVTKLIYWLKIQQGSEIQKAGELRELTVCEPLFTMSRPRQPIFLWWITASFCWTPVDSICRGRRILPEPSG